MRKGAGGGCPLRNRQGSGRLRCKFVVWRVFAGVGEAYGVGLFTSLIHALPS